MSIRPRAINLVAALACLLALAGCGEEQSRVAVTGNVTFDGEKLSSGSIIFKPNTADAGPQAAAKIVNGAYQLDNDNGPGLGGYDVLVYAEQPLEFEIDEPEEFFGRDDLKIPANTIPPQYNTRTTLAVVTQPGENQFDFSLTSEGNQP